MHDGAPTPLVWGALHGLHELCPDAENVFAGQYVHCVEPVSDATFPGGHASHARAPVPLENLPTGQDTHAEDPAAFAKLPAGQGTHEVMIPESDFGLL